MRALRQRKRIAAVAPPLAPADVPLAEAPPPRQVVRAVLEARAIGFAFQRLGQTAPHSLAWRCEKAGEQIIATLAECFGDEVV